MSSGELTAWINQVPATRRQVLILDTCGAQPRGGASFYLGRVPAELREQIPLSTVKPLFVRTAFQDSEHMRDTLRLSKALDVALRDAAGLGGEAPLVFVDTREMPDAYELTGGYAVDGDAVHVTAVLRRDDEEVASFEVSGRSDDVPALAGRVVAEAQRRLR